MSHPSATATPRRTTRHRVWARTALIAAVLAGAATAHAQPPPPRASDGVTIPSKSLVTTDDASATMYNPANLAFMPGVEARFMGVHTGNEARFVPRGYAWDRLGFSSAWRHSRWST